MSQPKCTPMKCSPCITCYSNHMSNDLPQNCHQQTDFTSFPVDSQSTLGNIIENYKLKIIEKDRILFDYSKNLKEAEKILESLRKSNETKEEANQQIKEQCNELSLKLNKTETLLMQKTEEATQTKGVSDQRLLVLSKENDSLIEKADNMQQIISQQDERIKQFNEENKKLRTERDKLTSTLDDHNITLVKYEKLFDEFKKENKQILPLKRQLSDLEGVALEHRNELNNLKLQNEKLAFEKEDAENKLQQFLSDTQIEKEKATSLTKIMYDYERCKKQAEEKDNENRSLTEKVRSSLKDNDAIAHIITSELGTFTTELESINMTTKGIMKLPISTIKSFNSTGLNNTFSLKYEMITKSIQSLKIKIVELVNEAILLITKLNDNHSAIEKEKQDLIIEKDNLCKEMTIMKNTNKELAIQAKEKGNSYNALNESYIKLKQIYVKLKANHSDVESKLDKLTSEYNDFISQLKSKIDKKLIIKKNETLTRYNSVDSILTPQLPTNTSVILTQLNNIIEDNYQMNDLIQKLQSNETSTIETIDRLTSEKSDYQSQFDTLSQKYQIEINQLTYDKEMELKEQKETLYEKIKSLTEILEESNSLIQSYEAENKQLKSRNVKLEYNLQMLTNSHIELEKSINNTSTTLQSSYDDKEAKYNSILREIELKDIQIKAYEKLLNQDPENPQQQIPKQVGRLISNSITMTPDFVKNEEHEKELHKLMYSYNGEGSEINTEQNNSSHSPQQEMRIEDDELLKNVSKKNNTIDVETSSGGGFNIKGKAPGKIYSSKKNK